MYPNRGEPGPSMEAQPQSAEQAPHLSDSQPETAATVEAAPSKQTSAPQAVAPSTDMALAAASTSIPSGDDDTNEQQVVSYGRPKDTGQIERQWVDRAKAIVAQTQDDPFKQKNEMSKVKADYIKQRFNKVVKTDPGAVWLS